MCLQVKEPNGDGVHDPPGDSRSQEPPIQLIQKCQGDNRRQDIEMGASHPQDRLASRLKHEEHQSYREGKGV